MSNYPLAQKIAKQKINQKKADLKKANEKHDFVTNFNELHQKYSPKKYSPLKSNKNLSTPNIKTLSEEKHKKIKNPKN
jgi:hypothetical protein